MLCRVGKSAPEPLSSACAEFEPGQDCLEAAEKVVSRIGARDCSCYLSLPGSFFYFKSLHLPFTERRKIDEVLRYELMDRISFSAEPFLFDSVAVARSEGGTRLLAAIVKEQELEPWLELLHAHGLTPELITVSSMGRLLELIVERNGDNSFLYVDGGAAASTCFLVRNGTLQAARSLAGAAEGAGHALRAELRRTGRALALDWDESESPELLLGGVMADQIDTALFADAELFGNVSVVDSGDIAIGGDSSGAQFPVYAQQALSATAALNPADPRLINLAEGAGKKSDKGKAIKRFAPLLALVLVAILLVSAYQLYDYFTLSRQHDRLAAEAAQIYRQTIGDDRSAADPLLSLKARIKEIDESAIGGIVEHPEIRAVAVIADISNRLPPSVQVSFDRLSFDRKTVRLNGVTDTYNDVDRIKQSLEASLLYTGVSIDSAGSSKEGGGVDFTLTLFL